MKYHHTKTESAEFLRLALPLMSKHEAPLNPISYAVWYEYVAGMNRTLNEAVDTLSAPNTLLTAANIETLFNRHVADIDSEASTSIAQAFQRIMGGFLNRPEKLLKMPVAQVLKDYVKGRDTAARYGGEEFIVLLPDTPLEGAQAAAEKIRRKVEAVRIKKGGSEEVGRVTISLGAARYIPGESGASFIERADQALYVAKNSGRNQVCVASAVLG